LSATQAVGDALRAEPKVNARMIRQAIDRRAARKAPSIVCPGEGFRTARYGESNEGEAMHATSPFAHLFSKDCANLEKVGHES
jgi:hypothetical protein